MSTTPTIRKKKSVEDAKPKRRESRIDLVTSKDGKSATSIASRISPVLEDGVRAVTDILKAKDPSVTVSSVVRDAVEAKVRAEFSAAGKPWPPASEEPSLPAS